MLKTDPMAMPPCPMRSGYPEEKLAKPTFERMLLPPASSDQLGFKIA